MFGVPRSGTKGLARALNLHPNVLCARERFDHRFDHSQVTFPDSFLDEPRIMNRLQRRKFRELQTTASGKRDILFVGNKYPRYYLTLERINEQVPDLRNLLIYRSPYGFMPSWNRKEREHKRASWLAGEVGLFGFLELLVCLQKVSRRKDVFVFPYDLGLNESVEPTLAALDFIGADPTSFDLATFAAKHMPRKAADVRRLPLQHNELELLEALEVRQLDEVLCRSGGVMTSELASELDDYMGSIRSSLPAVIDAAFAEAGNPAVVYYGAKFIDGNRRELADLLEMTAGSEFMAALQRFGPWRKLKYAYLQRSYLSSRLGSLTRRRTS